MPDHDLHALLEHGREGKLLADEDGTIRYANAAAADVFGAGAAALRGRNVFDLMTPTDAVARSALVARVRNAPDADHVASASVRMDDGSTRDVEVHIRHASAGEGGGGLLVSVSDSPRRSRSHRVAWNDSAPDPSTPTRRVLRAYTHMLQHATRLAERIGLAENHTEIYRSLLELARTTTPTDSLLVSHLDARSGVRTCVFAAEFVGDRYFEADVDQLPPMPPTDSPQSRAVRERRAIVTDDMLEVTIASVDIGDDDDDRPARASLAMPLIVMGEVLGVFEVQSTTPGAFEEEHLAQLQIAASLAAIAIKNLDLLSRERAARERAEVESARLEEVLEQAPTLTATLEGPEHVFVTANAKFERLFGGRPLVGLRVVDIVPEIEAQGVLAILDGVLATGASYVSHEMAIDLDTTGQGGLERHYFDLVYQPMRDGRAVHGVLAQAVDITAQVQARKDAEGLHASLQAAYDETIAGWARALDLKDEETAGHSQRVTDLTLALGRQMGLPEEDLVHVRRGALLHDIGKMGVPDRILLKAEALDPEEWLVMKRHAQYARDFLEPIEHLRPAIDIPYCHHEKWDGSGYPQGLVGTQIPIAARIFAVVDVFDALTNERPYRPAWTSAEALAHIEAGRGSHFAPDVVDAFLRLGAPGRRSLEGHAGPTP